MPTKDTRYYAHTIRLKLYGFFYAITYPFFFKKQQHRNKLFNIAIFNKLKNSNSLDTNLEINSMPFWTMQHAFTSYYDYSKHILFDKSGVAMCRKDAAIEYYNPLICAQVGLIAFNNFLSTKEEKYKQIAEQQLLNLTSKKTDFLGSAVWYYPIDYPALGIKSPWYSGITQGVILSFMIRMQSLGYDISEKDLTEIVESMFISVNEGGIYSEDPEPWVEEYPTTKSLKVLNGFIFSIIGLHEYYLCTKDQTVKVKLLTFYQSLFENLHHYQRGEFIKYCKSKAILSNIEYMPIYSGLFLHLYKLNSDEQMLQISEDIDKTHNHAAFERFYS
jgi:D-glucuronyl C5-epimerase C-terminus